MLFQSPVYSKASGSIAGLTYSHNRGGMYTRSRSMPTDPGTSLQQTVRSAMTSLAPYWGSDLSQAQRNGWDSYAAAVAMTNRLGETVYLTGQQHFLRCNVSRIQASMVVLDDAPTVYDLGTYTAPILSAADTTPQIDIDFNNADAWAIAVGGQMLVYVGHDQGAGRKFYKGPWRYAGKISGAVSPPSSPATIASPYSLAEDNVVWVQIRVIQVDGRLSSAVIIGPTTIEAP